MPLLSSRVLRDQFFTSVFLRDLLSSVKTSIQNELYYYLWPFVSAYTLANIRPFQSWTSTRGLSRSRCAPFDLEGIISVHPHTQKTKNVQSNNVFWISSRVVITENMKINQNRIVKNEISTKWTILNNTLIERLASNLRGIYFWVLQAQYDAQSYQDQLCHIFSSFKEDTRLVSSVWQNESMKRFLFLWIWRISNNDAPL